MAPTLPLTARRNNSAIQVGNRQLFGGDQNAAQLLRAEHGVPSARRLSLRDDAVPHDAIVDYPLEPPVTVGVARRARKRELAHAMLFVEIIHVDVARSPVRT